jgi:hypothetical protein
VGTVCFDRSHPPVWGLYVGGDLLSHTLPGAVPSALEGLASGFGKGPGVSRSAITTDTTIHIFTLVHTFTLFTLFTHFTLFTLFTLSGGGGPPTRVGEPHSARPPVTPLGWWRRGGGWLCVQGHTVDANTPLNIPTRHRWWGLSPRPISTGQLHPSQGFHPRPINPVVFWGPYPRPNPKAGGGGRPHLGTSFPLRCLQRLSLPNIANQPCPWRDNWHTRGPSVPVLSY